MGLLIKVEESAVEGDQAYLNGEVPPEALPFNLVLAPKQISVADPALAISLGFTETTTESLATQLFLSVITSLKVVVVVSPVNCFDETAALNPEGLEDHA